MAAPRAQHQLSFADVDGETSLCETTFVVVDLETTGSRAQAGPDGTRDAITEIGAVKVRGGEMDAAEVYRLKLERIPAPAGIMLDGRAVLYVERDPAHSNAVISSMAEDGTVVLTDVSIRDATVYDEDRAAAEAVVDKVLASEPAKKRRRKAASGSGAN